MLNFLTEKHCRLRGVAEVAAESSTEPLSAFNLCVQIGRESCRNNQGVLQTLVVALGVIVSKVFPNSQSQLILAEEDHSVQAILLD